MPKNEIEGCYTTKGIDIAMKNDPDYAIELLKIMVRYWNKDWGDMCDEDKKLNNMALKTKERVLASYNTSKGKVYIITDAGHKVTTVLFASEY